MADSMDLQISITGKNDTGSSFDSVDAALADIQKLAMDISKSFEDFAKSVQTSMSTASQSIQDMTAPLQADQSALDALAQTMDTVDRTAQTMGETASAAGREIQSSMESAAQAGTGLGEGLTSAEQGLRNTGDAAAGTTGSIDQLGQAIGAEMIGEQLKSTGEMGVEAFKSASEAASEFEFNISRIGAVLTTSGKATNSQMEQMSQDALKIGSSSSFSANQVAEGMYTLARQGLDASTILGDGINGAINIVNDLAQATDSDMTDTATVITDVVHEYGLSGAALRDVANTMSGALHNSSESLDDFYQSMKQVGPVASAMHQNALDVSTALALLAQHGITGSSAGTALKNMLLGLSPRTKAAAKDFEQLGISTKNGASNSFFDLQGNLRPLPDIINLLNEKFNGLSDAQKQAALSTVFTKYGLAGLNTIVGESRDKFVAFQNELKKDDAATIAAKKMDNLHGDLLKFNAGVQTMMKSFGDSINAGLRPLVQGASQAIQWITQLPKPIKEVGMAALGIGSALMIAAGSVIAFAGGVKLLGPAIEMSGIIQMETLETVAAGLGAVFTEILIPIGLIVAAIAVVGLGFKLAYDHIQPFHDLVNQVMERLKLFAQTLTSAILPVVKTVFDDISKVVMEAFDTVKTTIDDGLQTVYKWWMQYWPEIQQVFQEVWQIIRDLLAPYLAAMETTIIAGIGFIKGAWQNGWQAIEAILKAVWDLIKGVIQTAWAVISGIVATALDLLTGHFQKAGQDFVSTLKNAFNTILGMFQNLAGDALSFGSNFVQSIAKGIMGGIGAVTNAASSVISSVKSFISGGISGAISSATSAISSTLGIAKHADGGIFSTPHLGLVAEAGPEAVIPLSDPSRGLALWQQAGEMLGGFTSISPMSSSASPSRNGGGAVYNIYVNANGNITRNEKELGDIVSRAIYDKAKMQGKI